MCCFAQFEHLVNALDMRHFDIRASRGRKPTEPVRSTAVCLPTPDCSVDSECHYQRCLHTTAVVARKVRYSLPTELEGAGGGLRRSRAGVIYAVSLRQ